MSTGMSMEMGTETGVVVCSGIGIEMAMDPGLILGMEPEEEENNED